MGGIDNVHEFQKVSVNANKIKLMLKILKKTK